MLAHHPHRSEFLAELDQRTQPDTLDRAVTRVGLVMALAYDDEPQEPDQALRDLLTDVVHTAAARRLDMSELLDAAQRMAERERQEWAGLEVEERTLVKEPA